MTTTPDTSNTQGNLVIRADEPRSAEHATFELDQRRAKAYAESGFWPNTTSIAQAVVKIEAGRSLGLPAIIAMSEISVFKEKPNIGAGALATLVKDHPRYDYHVIELTNERCLLRFFQDGKPAGDSSFTMDDAVTAGLDKRNPTYKTYPRNMLFARAMSNGVAWYCPNVTGGRVYVPEDFPTEPTPDLPALEQEPPQDIVTVNDPDTGEEIEIEWPDPDENG